MAEPDFWSTHVFVLVSSDTVHRGLHGELVDRLRKGGFPPVAGRIVRANPEMIDDVYADLIAGQWQTWRYRLVDAVLAIGPAIALLCRHTGGPEAAHAALGRYKGAPRPAAAAPGTIRHDLGAINGLMNLLHSSDRPAESAREAAVFGLGEADAMPDVDHATEVVDYLCGLAAPARPETRDFDATLATVRRKLVAAMWEELPAATRDRLRAAFPEPSALATPGAGERLADLLGGAVAPAMGEVVRCEYTPDWRGRVRMSDAAESLRRLGVELDQWERLVLESSLQFAPLRSGDRPS